MFRRKPGRTAFVRRYVIMALSMFVLTFYFVIGSQQVLISWSQEDAGLFGLTIEIVLYFWNIPSWYPWLVQGSTPSYVGMHRED